MVRGEGRWWGGGLTCLHAPQCCVAVIDSGAKGEVPGVVLEMVSGKG